MPIMAMDDIGFELQKGYEFQSRHVEDQKTGVFVRRTVNILALGKIFFIFNKIYRQIIFQKSLPIVYADGFLGVQVYFYIFEDQFEIIFLFIDHLAVKRSDDDNFMPHSFQSLRQTARHISQSPGFGERRHFRTDRCNF